ncbi:helix-turn-helix transcriptional regulator [Singulisphaera sp. PoT]|uniref:helix-turn-helix transcriptional regulator n=1 Tax=Singulisphaera sp. PoT TaxID=3411797 RepID=UPI003BF4DE03
MDEKGLSQKGLGDRLDVSQTLVGNWLRKANVPSLDLALKLASEFDVSLDYLFNDQVEASGAEELRCEREIRRIVREIGAVKAWRRLIGVGEYPDQRPEKSGAGGTLPEMKSSKKDVG